MKSFRFLLYVMTISLSSSAIAQSNGEMPFTSSSPNTNELIRKAWVAMSDAHVEEGNKYVQQAIDEDPACAMAYITLAAGGIGGRSENISKAEGMKLSPDERLFVDVLKASHDKKPAQEYLNPLLKKYPKDSYLHLTLMFVLHKQEPSIAIGENVIKRNPKFAPVHNLLGYEYMEKNDMAKAQFHFDKYISLRPDLANPYDSKGDFLMRAGKTEEAIQLYEKAASLGMASSKVKAEEAGAKLKYPQLSEDDRVEIKKMLSASIDAYDQNNVETLLKDYSEQAVKIWGNQAVNVGMPNIRPGLSGLLGYHAYTKFDGLIESIDGVGTIAVAYGKSESRGKNAGPDEKTGSKENFIYLLRKRDDNNWRILADHFYGEDHGEPLSDEDRKSVKQLLEDWDHGHQSGAPLTEKQFEYYASLHSSQVIEIYPNEVSNIGTGNLLARVAPAVGITFEKSSLNPITIEGRGRRAVSWGIASQIVYPKNSDTPISRQYPWAMILTKEKDDIWRVLVIHWAP